MSTSPTPTGGHSDAPRRIWSVIVAVYFIALLFVSLRLIFTLWPGSDWVRSWYDGPQRSDALATVAEQGGKRIADALDELGRLEAKSTTSLSSQQATTINQTLSYADQILTLSIYLEKRQPAPEGPRWTPVSLDIPPRSQRENLTQLLQQAQARLMGTVSAARSELQRHPAFLDVMLSRPPPPHSGPSPLPPGDLSRFEAAYRANLEKQSPALLGSTELNYLVVIFLFGVLGACARGLASLARFMGNRSFAPQWSLFYLSQPWIGGALALAFYAVLRGGFMSTENSAAIVTNIHACSALGVLVGVSTAEALAKLRNLAEQFFTDDQEDDQDKDPARGPRNPTPKPVIQDVSLLTGGRLGILRGRQLQGATKLLVGTREMLIEANGDTAISFQVPPTQADLSPADLKGVVVETPAGASPPVDAPPEINAATG